MRKRIRWFCAVAAGFLSCALVTAEASNVLHMTLRDLVARGDRIVRGTVLAADEGTLQAGGGNLPAVTYRIRVEEVLKGTVAAGDVIEVRLLASVKQAPSGALRRASPLRDLPKFSVGRDYLFVLTRPSQIGLSTTVGLGQGLFELRGRPGQELAVNEANNLGLFNGLPAAPAAGGPVAYVSLAKEIRTLLGR
jgi:hypothetical protein